MSYSGYKVTTNKKNIIAIIVFVLIVAGLLFGIYAEDNELFTKKTTIETIMFEDVSDEKLGFGFWGGSKTYEYNLIVEPSNINIKDVKLISSDPKIMSVEIIRKRKNKIEYKVTSIANGTATLRIETEFGSILNNGKKFIVSGGKSPSYTREERSIMSLTEIENVSMDLAHEVYQKLVAVGINLIENPNLMQEESEEDAGIIIAMFDGLVIDIEIKNNELLRILVNSNGVTVSLDEELVLYDKLNDELTRELTDEEFEEYKSSQEYAKFLQIRKYVDSMIELEQFIRTTANSVGGIDMVLSVKNNSDKTIKAVDVGFLATNSLGNEVYCNIRGKGLRLVTLNGPLEPGEISGDRRAENYWYNSLIRGYHFSFFAIEYTDGSIIIFDEDMMMALRMNFVFKNAGVDI